MKKNEKIQDSPEFQYYKNDFENFKKEMEDDKEIWFYNVENDSIVLMMIRM